MRSRSTCDRGKVVRHHLLCVVAVLPQALQQTSPTGDGFLRQWIGIIFPPSFAPIGRCS
jgi:hypothetical protein